MIKNIIYNYLEDISKIKKERELERVLTWSPTAYCRCLRQTYFKKINKEATNPLSIHTLLKFEMGHGIHYQLKELYKKIDKFYKKNPDVREIDFDYIEPDEEYMEFIWDDIKFIYQPDDIIKVNGTVFLIENKTKYGQGIESLKHHGIEPDYEIQLLLYMIFLKIDKGEFYFVATDSAYNQDFFYSKESLVEKHKQYMVNRNKKIKKTLKSIENYHKEKIEEWPEREGQINLKNDRGEIKYEFQCKNEKYKSFPCTWGKGKNKCGWFDLCWKEELEEIKNNSFYIGGKFIK